MLGAGAAIIAVIMTLLTTGSRMGKMSGTLEEGMKAQNAVIGELKDEVIGLRRVVTDIAVANKRMDNQDQQILQLRKEMDELKHGEGFVMPLTRLSSPHG